MRIPFAAPVATIACAVLAIACSARSSTGADASTPTTAPTVTGTVSPVKFAPVESVGVVRALPSSSGDVAVLLVIVSDRGGLCSATKSPGTTLLGFQVFAPGTAMVPGTYSVVPESQSATAPFANTTLEVFDTSCAQSTNDEAAGGTITITAVDGATASGTYDVTFASGHLTGTFDASLCLSADWNGVC